MKAMKQWIRHPYTVIGIPALILVVIMINLVVIWMRTPWKILEFGGPDLKVGYIRVVSGVPGQEGLRKLLDKRHAELDAETDALMRRTGPEAWSDQWAWYATLRRPEPDLIRLLDDWVSQTGSPAAHLSRALYLYRFANVARGTGWWQDVSAWDRFRFRYYLDRTYADLQEVLKAGAPYWLAYWVLVDAARFQGDQEAARRWFEQGIALTPGNPRLYDALYYALGTEWGAEPGARKALLADIDRLIPEYPQLREVALYRRIRELEYQPGARCDKLGSYQSLLDQYRYEGTLGELGKAWYCANDFQRAEHYLAEATALAGYRADYWAFRAMAALDGGKPDLAARYADIATALAPAYALGWQARGEAAMRQKDYALAEGMFRNAADVDDENYHRHVSFAQLAARFRQQPDRAHDRMEWTVTGELIAREGWQDGVRHGKAFYKNEVWGGLSEVEYVRGEVVSQRDELPDDTAFRLQTLANGQRKHIRVETASGHVLEEQALSGFPGEGHVRLATRDGTLLVDGTHTPENRFLTFHVPHADADGLRLALVPAKRGVMTALAEKGGDVVDADQKPLFQVFFMADGVELKAYDLEVILLDPAGNIRFRVPVRLGAYTRFQSETLWFDPPGDRLPGEWTVVVLASGHPAVRAHFRVRPSQVDGPG